MFSRPPENRLFCYSILPHLQQAWGPSHPRDSHRARLVSNGAIWTFSLRKQSFDFHKPPSTQIADLGAFVASVIPSVSGWLHGMTWLWRRRGIERGSFCIQSDCSPHCTRSLWQCMSQGCPCSPLPCLTHIRTSFRRGLILGGSPMFLSRPTNEELQALLLS